MVLVFYKQADFVGMEFIMNSYHYKAGTSFYVINFHYNSFCLSTQLWIYRKIQRRCINYHPVKYIKYINASFRWKIS